MQCPVVPIRPDSRLSELIACAGQAQPLAASAPSTHPIVGQSPDPKSAQIEYDADLIVVGCGPAGQAAAFQAAKAKKKVTVIDERGTEGGVCVHTGTIPSKTLREAARRLLLECKGAQNVCPEDMHRLWWTVEEVISSEVGHIRDDFSRNGIKFIGGKASLVSPDTVKIIIPRSGDPTTFTEMFLQAPAIILATGSTPRRPAGIEFDSTVVLTGDEVLSMTALPKTLAIIGGGVIGSEYASIFAALGVQVTIIDRGSRLLSSLDSSLSKEFELEMKRRKVEIVHQADVQSCRADASKTFATIALADGREIITERVIVCAGREGSTQGLGLETVGVQTDKRGNISRANPESFRTTAPSVLAAGDVLGGFGLASTATIEGHSAAADAIGLKEHKVALPLPKGIYAMPEMASVGSTEEDLIATNVPYVTAQARFAETSKGVIRDEHFGFLKMLVHAETRHLLGVHIIGEDAAELIHIGQLLIATGQTVDDLIGYAFNQPTFAEAYKKAGFRCWNRLNGSQSSAVNS